MKRSIRAITERVFELFSVGVGLLILGSCTYAGYAQSGVKGALLSFLPAAVIALLLVAFVFMITRTSADVRAIRDHIDRPTATGESEQV